MNQELESKVPVAEQLNEIEKVEEAISAEYSLNSDGTIQQVCHGIENPEGSGA